MCTGTSPVSDLDRDLRKGDMRLATIGIKDGEWVTVYDTNGENLADFRISAEFTLGQALAAAAGFIEDVMEA